MLYRGGRNNEHMGRMVVWLGVVCDSDFNGNMMFLSLIMRADEWAKSLQIAA